MAAKHQKMLHSRQPQQRKPQQRRTGQVKARAPLLLQNRGQPLLTLTPRKLRQVEAAPRRRHSRHDHLHRTAQSLVPERRPQAGMARHQSLRRSFQHPGIERALEPEHQLHRVDVGRLRVIQRMEQQPLLQRRQRQDVLDPPILLLQPFDLSLRQRYQRQVAGRAAAGAGLIGLAHQSLQRTKPAPRQVPHIRFRQQRRRPRPARLQPRSRRPLHRQRIDLDRVRQRHPRVAAAAQRHPLGGRRPVSAPRTRKPTEIVEPKLRHRKPGKRRPRLAVEVAQQPIAQTMVRHRSELLLDQLERPTQRRTARNRLRQYPAPRHPAAPGKGW